MSYGPHTRNPWEEDDAIDHAEAPPLCACGDARCYLDPDDATNVNVNGSWFTADCVGLCIACNEVDDLSKLMRVGGGRFQHAIGCPDRVK